MQKKTRSILEELELIHQERNAHQDRQYIIESRAHNVIAAAIRLIEQIETTYAPDKADNITRKLLNAIRDKDPQKFIRSVRKTHAD